MTYGEFLKDLRKTNRKWCLTPSLWITGTFLIRTIKNLNGYNESPITAVARDIYGYGVGIQDTAKVLVYLGLAKRVAQKIMEAIDGKPGHDPKIRRDLLRACGLKESK